MGAQGARMERLTYTVEEAAAAFGCGTNRMYELVASGQVPAIRLPVSASARTDRASWLVPRHALAEWALEEARRQQRQRLGVALAEEVTPIGTARRRRSG